MKTLVKWSVDDYHRTLEAGILRDRRGSVKNNEMLSMKLETPTSSIAFRCSSFYTGTT